MTATLVTLLLLGLLIMVHEFGHFVVARWVGVRVLRFSLGFGPRLFAWTRGHTEYAVSAIPLGGYVKMAGEQREQHTHEPWEYLSKPVGVRAAIVFAGPLVNYLVAILSLWMVFRLGYPEALPVVGKLVDGMPAQAAGLRVGDRIQAINGQKVTTWEEMTRLIYSAPDRPLAFAVERGDSVEALTITPQRKMITDVFGQPKHVGLIGVVPSGEFRSQPLGALESAKRAMRKQSELVGQTLTGFWLMATGKLPMRDSVTGPIGIMYMTWEAAQQGIAPLLALMSLFSLSLAIFNLFPIPILDGGHLFFLLIEQLRGVPVSLRVQERSAQVSFVLLMALILVVCVNDVNRFGLIGKLTGLFGR